MPETVALATLDADGLIMPPHVSEFLGDFSRGCGGTHASKWIEAVHSELAMTVPSKAMSRPFSSVAEKITIGDLRDLASLRTRRQWVGGL
jgi:hypothetical protein